MALSQERTYTIDDIYALPEGQRAELVADYGNIRLHIIFVIRVQEHGKRGGKDFT